jgi:transcriptional regulator
MMWVHKDYDDASADEIRRFVLQWPLAVVIANEPELRVAHAPAQLRTGPDGRDELVGHVAAADPIASSLRDGTKLLVCFTGPRIYVSPRWYADRGLPTYNFVAVHFRGTARPLTEPGPVVAHLMSLVRDHERSAPKPWRVDTWARARTVQLLNELQAFTMAVDSVEAKVKMSQNRTEADRERVMSMLEGASDDGAAAALRLMRDRFDVWGADRPR